VHQHEVAAGAFHDGADGGAPCGAEDEVALRKTVEGPGEPGVA
jgi:hypothetical protein